MYRMPPGKYFQAEKIEMRCKRCERGMYTSEEGKAVCTRCPLGYSTLGESTIACEQDPDGTPKIISVKKSKGTEDGLEASIILSCSVPEEFLEDVKTAFHAVVGYRDESLSNSEIIDIPYKKSEDSIITDLKLGATYYFRVQSVFGNDRRSGFSSWSDHISCPTKPTVMMTIRSTLASTAHT